MPPTNRTEGIDVANRLRETHPRVGVIVLSQFADPTYAHLLFDGGSTGRGYLIKDRVGNRDELVAAIQQVAAGGSVLDPTIIDALLESPSRAAAIQLDRLTTREREVLTEMASGKSNAAIAQSLVISKRAVEHHVRSIFAKLDLPDAPHVSRRVSATLMFLGDRAPSADG